MRTNALCVSASASAYAYSHFPNPHSYPQQCALLQNRTIRILLKHRLSLMPTLPFTLNSRRRRTTFICAANQEAEEAFKKTVEIDKLIDMLREANPREKDYEELAATVMTVVDRVVHKTKEKIESSTDVLKQILNPVVDDEGEIHWPPRDPQALVLMEKEISQREQEGQLDEGFLAEVNAQLRQAKEDGDKPGLEAMMQKVLQLYASNSLSKRSYATKGKEVLKDEQFLETIIQAPEEQWNNILINGLTVGAGDISPEELDAVLKKRIERTLIRTEGGSYQQRILTEYLKGIETRAIEIVQVLQRKPR